MQFENSNESDTFFLLHSIVMTNDLNHYKI